MEGQEASSPSHRADSVTYPRDARRLQQSWEVNAGVPSPYSHDRPFSLAHGSQTPSLRASLSRSDYAIGTGTPGRLSVTQPLPAITPPLSPRSNLSPKHAALGVFGGDGAIRWQGHAPMSSLWQQEPRRKGRALGGCTCSS